MAFNQPARQSLIARMVPRESVGNAVALNSAAMNVMRIGGPSLAGLILTALDFGDLYVIQAFMYGWVMLWTYQISIRTSATNRENRSFFSEFREGIDAIRADKPILYILCLSLMLFIWGFPYQSVFVPLIATRVLDVGRSGAGLLVSLIGIGALFGSLTVATAGGSMGRRGVVMLVQVSVFCAALLVFSRAESMFVVIPALIISGAMQTSFMSLNNAFVLARTPPEIQGRVMSLFTLDRGLVPLGATLGGVLASALGPQDGLTVMACICIGCTVLIALLVPAVRRVQ
jgi:predicted MFS family arabinose efflux permease